MTVHLPVTLDLSRHRCRPWLPLGRRIRTLTLRSDGLLDIVRADDATETCRVDGQTTVYSWLVVLRYCGERGVESLVLPRLTMDAADHRRLRLWLKWKAATD